MREGGATQWAAVEADLLADGSGAGAPVAFSLFVDDWRGVAALAVVAAAPGSVVATLVEPGVFAVSGLVRGAAAAFYPLGASPPPAGFAVGVAAGRNASEANAWGSTFVFDGEWCGARRSGGGGDGGGGVGDPPLPCAPSPAPRFPPRK